MSTNETSGLAAHLRSRATSKKTPAARRINAPLFTGWAAALVVVSALVLLSSPAAAQSTRQNPDSTTADLLFILDASGSMWGQIKGQAKIVIAREVMGSLIDNLPRQQPVGLLAYGHRREGDCADIELVSKVAPLDSAALKKTVGTLNPKGKTPITASLERAFAEVRAAANARGSGATVILVSDGLETCNADPCAAVKKAKDAGLDFVLHIIGFDVAKEDVSSLECAAQAGGGLFLAAEDAGQLAGALDTAVALQVGEPAGGLSVQVTSNGKLQDAAVRVKDRATGKWINGSRTYAAATTNPRRVPLPAGGYTVEVSAVGLKGDVVRTFELDLAEGETHERQFDFSSGTLSVFVTRNGAITDSTVRALVAGTQQDVAGGRTYRSAASNPEKMTLTAGTYDVFLQSVEILGTVRHTIPGVKVEPNGVTSITYDYKSGTLRLGAQRAGALLDVSMSIYSLTKKASVGGGRTYTSAESNPKEFVVEPGEYRIDVQPRQGERKSFTLSVKAGEVVEKTFEL